VLYATKQLDNATEVSRKGTEIVEVELERLRVSVHFSAGSVSYAGFDQGAIRSH
jgi:hypothetical protein